MKTLSFIIALVTLCRAAANAETLDGAQSLAADFLAKGRFAAEMAQGAGRTAENLTALQKHVAFFDKNHDGVITVSETTLSLRQLGLSRIKAETTALVIHAALGPKTSGRWTTDVSVAGIQLGRHGSDSGAFDAQGRFVPVAFERIFAEFDLNRSGSMSAAELEAMTAANSKLRPGGSFASSQEFKLLMLVSADTTEGAAGKPAPAISRTRLQEFYDGTLFYKLARPI